MKVLHLKNAVWQEGNFYVAQCLNVDVNSFGETKQEALANLNEALALYFEDADTTSFQDIKGGEIIDSKLDYA